MDETPDVYADIDTPCMEELVIRFLSKKGMDHRVGLTCIHAYSDGSSALVYRNACVMYYDAGHDEFAIVQPLPKIVWKFVQRNTKEPFVHVVKLHNILSTEQAVSWFNNKEMLDRWYKDAKEQNDKDRPTDT